MHLPKGAEVEEREVSRFARYSLMMKVTEGFESSRCFRKRGWRDGTFWQQNVCVCAWLYNEVCMRTWIMFACCDMGRSRFKSAIYVKMAQKVRLNERRDECNDVCIELGGSVWWYLTCGGGWEVQDMRVRQDFSALDKVNVMDLHKRVSLLCYHQTSLCLIFLSNWLQSFLALSLHKVHFVLILLPWFHSLCLP